MNLQLASLSVLMPDAHTIPLSFQKTTDVCQKTCSHYQACHINIRNLAGNVTWRPRNRGHQAFSLFRRDRFRFPPPPRRSTTKLESNCGLSDSSVISKAGFPRMLLFVLPRRIHFETPFQIQVNMRECIKTPVTRNEQGKRKEWSYE